MTSMTEDPFRVRLGTLMERFARTLEAKVEPGSPLVEGPIGASFRRAVESHDAGDVRGREIATARMSFLLKHLVEIRRHDAALQQHFCKKLHDLNLGNYLGTRLEIATAASLARKDLEFTSRSKGGPDFTAHLPQGDVGIECSSASISPERQVTSETDLLGKIVNRIREKAAKPYARSTTALFLDITNLESWSLGTKKPLFGPDNQEALAIELGVSDLGALLLFSEQIEWTGQRLRGVGWRFRRCDNTFRNPLLGDFLDAHYGPSGNWPEAYTVPLLT